MNRNDAFLILGLVGIAATALLIERNRQQLIRLAEKGHKVRFGNAFLSAEVN